MNAETLRIDLDRLHGRLDELGRIGALPGGGVARLALSDADREGRDLVVGWMRELGLQVSVDRIGNVLGLRPGESAGPPVTIGSHIDTVKAGGIYDGNLGVLAGLEVVAVLNDAGVVTRRPLAVGFFTNEEGSRFAPDMMGSAVHQGFLDLEQALAVRGIDGKSVAEELARIGYAGEAPTGGFRAHSYFELHVEQGPVLEQEGVQIGAVEGVQGISWTEYSIRGVSNHAGTTPMRMRRDAGYLAAAISVEARAIAREMGGDQVATTGHIQLKPNLVNVIPGEALITVDLRNTYEALLQEAERRMYEFVERTAAAEGLEVRQRVLARFEPVTFDPVMVDSVEREAANLGYSVRRMPSGAGHDAQMFAPNCPTAMVFVPSVRGISHNPAEFTTPEQIGAGAQVLLGVVLQQLM
ncbi:MAG: Zn-dependent hydrolase [Gammaproteobacteria bacterium]|nr:Zn-dependent hydrolase [Gammaproteobacteria bacterium]